MMSKWVVEAEAYAPESNAPSYQARAHSVAMLVAQVFNLCHQYADFVS